MASAEIAVIFDMDGVLIDSYEAHLESWQVVAREEGTDMTREQFGRTFGRTSRETITVVWPDKGDDPDAVRDFDHRKEVAFRKIITDRFPTMPGAVDLLDHLAAADISVAVGSSGPTDNVDLVVEKLGGAARFGAVVTGNDVTRGKPDPQVFLIAAERLGLPAQRCIVVEDSRPGLKAARAAGMACVGLASTGHTRDELSLADLVVDTLSELGPDVFRRLLNAAQSP